MTTRSIWSSWWSSSADDASTVEGVGAWTGSRRRNPGHSQKPVVIFADPDGSLLDHRMHPCGSTCEAMEVLADRGIPVVLCSNRTRAELELIQQEFGFRHPFISESGSVIRSIGLISSDVSPVSVESNP